MMKFFWQNNTVFSTEILINKPDISESNGHLLKESKIILKCSISSQKKKKNETVIEHFGGGLWIKCIVRTGILKVNAVSLIIEHQIYISYHVSNTWQKYKFVVLFIYLFR
jgi:hypothetical protein